VNDDFVQTIWRVSTLPVRIVLQGLLWIFAPNGTPLRAVALIMLIFVVAQLVQVLNGN
jgi:hypothetical protein